MFFFEVPIVADFLKKLSDVVTAEIDNEVLKEREVSKMNQFIFITTSNGVDLAINVAHITCIDFYESNAIIALTTHDTITVDHHNMLYLRNVLGALNVDTTSDLKTPCFGIPRGVF